MAIKYYKLQDLLNKRGLSKGQLQNITGFSSATIAKLSSNSRVSLDVIDKVCNALNVQPGDILEYVPNDD